LKYECNKLKITCYFCRQKHSREFFKGHNHPCSRQLDSFMKFFTSSQPAENQEHSEVSSLDFPQGQAPIFDKSSLDHKNELPTIINLFSLVKQNSLLNLQTCLIDTCRQRFEGRNEEYSSDIKLTLHKEDGKTCENCCRC